MWIIINRGSGPLTMNSEMRFDAEYHGGRMMWILEAWLQQLANLVSPLLYGTQWAIR